MNIDMFTIYIYKKKVLIIEMNLLAFLFKKIVNPF